MCGTKPILREGDESKGMVAADSGWEVCLHFFRHLSFALLYEMIVVAAGGRIIKPPYPAAGESSGIYMTSSAAVSVDTDARNAWSSFRCLRPLIAVLYVFRLSRRVSKPVWRSLSSA
jgi:hypothetical protein